MLLGRGKQTVAAGMIFETATNLCTGLRFEVSEDEILQDSGIQSRGWWRSRIPGFSLSGNLEGRQG